MCCCMRLHLFIPPLSMKETGQLQLVCLLHISTTAGFYMHWLFLVDKSTGALAPMSNPAATVLPVERGSQVYWCMFIPGLLSASCLPG